MVTDLEKQRKWKEAESLLSNVTAKEKSLIEKIYEFRCSKYFIENSFDFTLETIGSEKLINMA